MDWSGSVEVGTDGDLVLEPGSHFGPGHTPQASVDLNLGTHCYRVPRAADLGLQGQRLRLAMNGEDTGKLHQASANWPPTGRFENDGGVLGNFQEVRCPQMFVPLLVLG